MVGLVIYWDLHVNMLEAIGGSKRWLSTYLFSAEAFGIDKVLVIGQPDVSHGYSMRHEEFSDLQSLLKKYHKHRIVACVGNVPAGIKPVSLESYKHRADNVLYMIGSDYNDIEFEKIKKRKVDYVTIKNMTNVTYLWSNVVAGIVLRDRYIKIL